MKKEVFIFLLIAMLSSRIGYAQSPDSTTVKLIFPDQAGWQVIREGTKLEFRLKALGGRNSTYTFSIPSGKVPGVNFDSLGNFSWTPSYDFVDRLQESKSVQMLFEARNKEGETATEQIDFKVIQVNQAPDITELKTLYLQNNVLNTYQIDPAAVKDTDGDPIVFIPITDQMPEGAKLSSKGEFTWKPSLGQFNQLKSKPITLEFIVEDQPAKAQIKGKFRIEATSMDLPPDITLVPNVEKIRYQEGVTIALKFYLSDPNGDDNIKSFDFISEDARVPKKALVQNTPTQYEFIWTPSYNMVSESQDSLTFNLDFFVIDKTNKRTEKIIKVTILDTENEQEKDQNLYKKYRTALVSAWDLLEQLKEREKELKGNLNEAKKGKKNRAIMNASLGAVTGITPAIPTIPTTSQKMVSSIGGTTVMTMGTLEATNVIGKSQAEINEKMNATIEKKNELQAKGDTYARKYALASARRNPTFATDTQDFLALLNLKGTLALELDASWKNNKNATDNQISRTFRDFSPFTE
jgi:hypothetical protein